MRKTVLFLFVSIVLTVSFLSSCKTISSFFHSDIQDKSESEEKQDWNEAEEVERVIQAENAYYDSIMKMKVNYKANQIDLSTLQFYLDEYSIESLGYNEEHFDTVRKVSQMISDLKSYYDTMKEGFDTLRKSINDAFEQGDKEKAESAYSKIVELYNTSLDFYMSFSNMSFASQFEEDYKQYFEEIEKILFKVRNPWTESELHNSLISNINDKHIDLPIYASSEKMGASLRNIIDSIDYRDYSFSVSDSLGLITIDVKYGLLYDFRFTAHYDGIYDRIVLDTVKVGDSISSYAYDLAYCFKFAFFNIKTIEYQLNTYSLLNGILW